MCESPDQMRSPRQRLDAPSSASRRHFLRVAAMAAPALLVPGAALADAMAPRALSFVHTHTSERLSLEYFTGGHYLPDALGALNRLMRDFRTGDIQPIDPRLFDLLHALRGQTGATAPYQIISGYRSPVTNAALRQRSEGVASGSLHMRGQAVDIRLSDVPLAEVRRAAVHLRLGGVGYYPGSNFVHVDTGRVRTW